MVKILLRSGIRFGFPWLRAAACHNSGSSVQPFRGRVARAIAGRRSAVARRDEFRHPARAVVGLRLRRQAERVAEPARQHLGEQPASRHEAHAGARHVLAVEHEPHLAGGGAALHPVVAAIVGDLHHLVGNREIAEVARLVETRGEAVAIARHPVPHRAVRRHAGLAADIQQGAAGAQPVVDPLRQHAGVARGNAARMRIAAITIAEAAQVPAHPAMHRAHRRHAVVAADLAELAAELGANAIGDGGGVIDEGAFHGWSLVDMMARGPQGRVSF